MSKQRVILRADAGKKTGYGHFVRSLALANHLKDDFDCRFATYNEDEPYGTASDNQLQQLSGICKPLEFGGINIREADRMFLDYLVQDDVVVLDNYYFTTDYQKQIKAKGCRLVCIDDMPDRHFVCDVLITGTPYDRSDFSIEPYTVFKSGIEWFFLRDAFLKPPRAREYESKIRNMVVAMGGSDALNLTDKIITIIQKVIPEASIRVIAGSGVTVNHEGAKGVDVYRNLSADDMVRLYEEADAALLPASTVSIEALSRDIKVYAGHYVDNQRRLYRFGVNKGYYIPLGNLLDSEGQIASRLSNAINLNYPHTQLTCFQNQRHQTVDLFRKLSH